MATPIPIHKSLQQRRGGPDVDRLSAAIALATEVFYGVTDRAGVPYIVHCMRVMSGCEARTRHSEPDHREDVLVTAVLHDVLEDADREKFPHIEDEVYEVARDNAYSAILAITKRRGESYDDYIQRVCGNWISCIVKDEDLDHNSDLERLPEILPEDIQRRERYARAKTQIREAVLRAAS